MSIFQTRPTARCGRELMYHEKNTHREDVLFERLLGWPGVLELIHNKNNRGLGLASKPSPVLYLISITKSYITRTNKENRNKGKYYNWKKSTGGYIPLLMRSREETLGYVPAHELRHFYQCSHPGKRGKVWGARGRFSDRDADAYAIRKTREWCRQYNNNTAGLEGWP
jgi:hypothetical protein